ncbi:toxin-antitoxin system YwqK family antitoxin [Butyrivibrio hungatei]|uniref:MORN repeat-containing protein n=1 Tax=Butyrivibrio hungatei TaxID=185008 RepID=A0A1D9P308_9FIRM|nr:hypothetical protein [Butyrivibrio hungatei]AOZ96899.1 hypothetical protein bhn_I1866 [Butyrivibrio hungatei]
MEILSSSEVISKGVEFIGEVCFSGEYGEQVYTKEDYEGGVPIEGILYEKYENGNLAYYAFYHEGIPQGQRVRFYPSGRVKSYCIMDAGTVDGYYTEWYENGNIKCTKYCKYGLTIQMKEYDIQGNIAAEKKELKDSEKSIFEKRKRLYG